MNGAKPTGGCRLCAAMRAPLPAELRRRLEDMERRREAQRLETIARRRARRQEIGRVTGSRAREAREQSDAMAAQQWSPR